MGGVLPAARTHDLRLPLREGDTTGGSDNGTKTSASPSHTWVEWSCWVGADLLASVLFWTALGYLPDSYVGAVAVAILVAMVLWRVWRLQVDQRAEVPYSCGFVEANGKELFLVATVHISPRAPKDVKAVIQGVNPDVAMIELDEERLDRLRSEALQRQREPDIQDLQPVKISHDTNSEPLVVSAQRALWNAERAGEHVSGRLIYEQGNEFGLGQPGENLTGQIALVRRGGPGSQTGPFAIKAHLADKAGAKAVLVINHEERLPVWRLGSATLCAELRVAFQTRNLGFPRVPVLLLPHSAGDRLRQECEEGTPVQVEFDVAEDKYPRRTLPMRICQMCALLFSGIGVLYGIIGCFDVEVGAEFTEAEAAATSIGIPCACIDVDLNRFWARVGATVIPTPCNVGSSLLSWLAFPRVLACFLFPPRQNVDLVGSMLLHLKSLPVRTWIAFIAAGYGASLFVNLTLELCGDVSERGAEAAGVVNPKDRAQTQSWMLPLLEAYLLPQICQAVAASRDEAMYRAIVAKGRELNAHRLVAVVGGGHANGILQYARRYGL